MFELREEFGHLRLRVDTDFTPKVCHVFLLEIGVREISGLVANVADDLAWRGQILVRETHDTRPLIPLTY